MKKTLIVFSIVLFSLFATDGYSQCSMCRRVAESSNENENKPRKGLNTGILYLLSIPYILGGIGVFMWYKNRNK